MQNSGNLQEVLHGSMVQNNKVKGFISRAARIEAALSCSYVHPSVASAFPAKLRGTIIHYIDFLDTHYPCQVDRRTIFSCLFALVLSCERKRFLPFSRCYLFHLACEVRSFVQG